MPFSHLPKIGAFTVLAMSIAACSSNNHHNALEVTPIPNSSNAAAADKAAAEKAAAEKAAAEKATADKAAAEKAAADKAAAEKAAADKAAADRAAAEKAAADRAAAEKAAAEKAAAEKAAADKAAAEKAAAEKAAADRAAAEKAAAEKAAAEKAAADKAAADRAAAEKAAAEKAAADRAAAEKAAAEKAAAEKAAAEKAAAEKAAAEKAERERLAAIEANRVALLAKAKEAGLTEAQAIAYATANKEADATAAQTALDNLVAAKLAAEKAEAERLAAEKAERERLAAIETNRVALLAKAKEAGLTEAQATAYATANKEATAEAAKTALDGIVAENKRIADKKADLTIKAQAAGLNADRAKTFADKNVNTADDAVANALKADVAKAVTADKGGTYTGTGLTNDTKVTSQSSGYGQITTPYGTTNTSYTKTEKSVNKTYNQPYSVVVGKGTVNTTTDNYSSYNSSTSSTFKIDKVAGLATLEENLPKTGKAIYLGEAFAEFDKTGKLYYAIDFDKRKGSGAISGWESEFGQVVLKEADLTKTSISGKDVIGVSGLWSGTAANSQFMPAVPPKSDGTYSLGLYGANAEEIAGSAAINASSYYLNASGKTNSYSIGFAGQKDDTALETEQKLIKMATNVGLTEAHAKTFAQNNLKTDSDNISSALTKEAQAQVWESKEALLTKYGIGKYTLSSQGYNQYTIDESKVSPEGLITKRKGWNNVYQQPYSMIISQSIHTDIKDDVDQLNGKSISNKDFYGFITQSAGLPTEGKAVYLGNTTTNSYNAPKLTYNVDFGKRTGSGFLIYQDTYDYGGKITLGQGGISKLKLNDQDVLGISGIATPLKPLDTSSLRTTTGGYELGFYGPQAQEILGSVKFTTTYSYPNETPSVYTIDIAGQRGEITK